MNSSFSASRSFSWNRTNILMPSADQHNSVRQAAHPPRLQETPRLPPPCTSTMRGCQTLLSTQGSPSLQHRGTIPPHTYPV